MEAIYVIETKCGHTVRLQFKEVRNDKDYGNGIYVICVNLESPNDAEYLDLRYYVNYDFETFCKERIEFRYGNNLKSYQLELLPCPFCGGQAKVHYFGKPGALSVTVRCKRCKAQVEPIHKMAHYSIEARKEQVIKEWNKRR